MKLNANINEESVTVDVRREGGKVFATVGERSYELDAHATEANTWLFKLDGKIYECYVSPEPIAGQTRVSVGTDQFELTLTDPKRLRGAGGDHAHGDGAAEIKTQMPGKVVRILLEAGAEVQKGDGVIVVEAMKMQNEMKSPKDGIIKEIRFAEGNTVNAGDVLVVIE